MGLELLTPEPLQKNTDQTANGTVCAEVAIWIGGWFLGYGATPACLLCFCWLCEAFVCRIQGLGLLRF